MGHTNFGKKKKKVFKNTLENMYGGVKLEFRITIKIKVSN